jgi:hypothetical protein
MHTPPPLFALDYIGPGVGAVLFVLVMSLVKEPARRTFNAILVAGAGGVYLTGGFGLWELLYAALATPIAYLGLRSYRFIALAWVMHSSWDIAHHLWGNPIWPFMPTSSFGCMIRRAHCGVVLRGGALVARVTGTRGPAPSEPRASDPGRQVWIGCGSLRCPPQSRARRRFRCCCSRPRSAEAPRAPDW